jgi:hypothetical protein
MRGVVFRGGQKVKVKDVPRGRPILRTAEEWHRRQRAHVWDNWWVVPIIHALIVYPIWIGLDLLLEGTVRGNTLVNATAYYLTYMGMMFIMEVYQSNRELGRGNYSGLFDHGIQLRQFDTYLFFFFPYCEIIDFRVKTGWFWQTLELDIPGMRKPFKLQGMPEILGEEGLAELRRRVDASAGRFEMPKLVLYGQPTPVVATTSPPVNPTSRSPVFTAGLRF